MNIFFINCTRLYPTTFNAENTKFGLMAKGLVELGHNVFIFNRIYGEYEDESNDYYKIENYNGIQIITFKKIKSKIKAFTNYYLLYNLIKNNKNSNNLIITAAGNFLYSLPNIFISKLLNIKIAYIWHEWLQYVSNNSNKWNKINNALTDNYLGYLVDYIYPISHFLEAKAQKFKKPYKILPIMADYSTTNNYKLIKSDNYFLYCGSVDYKRIIDFIIDSYSHYKNNNGQYNLKLVLYGEKDNIDSFRKDINNSNLNQYISIFSHLQYQELFNLYANAKSLLIPLDHKNKQDTSRFSQKIAEYLSSKRPIITVNVGEIPYYFNDKIDALILNNLDKYELTRSLLYCEDNDEQINQIGIKGYELGLNNFDYKIVMKDILSIIKE